MNGDDHIMFLGYKKFQLAGTGPRRACTIASVETKSKNTKNESRVNFNVKLRTQGDIITLNQSH